MGPEVREPSVSLQVTRHTGLTVILNTDKGRGVFATESIPAGTVVEVCPVLVFSPSDAAHVELTAINDYSYNWISKDVRTGEGVRTQALPLGLGSIFNHSRRQNVGFRRDFEKQCITYSTLRDIHSGEELCISYGLQLWFDDTEPNIDEESDDALGDIAKIDL